MIGAPKQDFEDLLRCQQGRTRSVTVSEMQIQVALCTVPWHGV